MKPEDVWLLPLIFLGTIIFLRLLASMASTGQQNAGRPINPNMTEPCPPHNWADPPQKGLGIVYQCTKCGQRYPSSVEQRD